MEEVYHKEGERIDLVLFLKDLPFSLWSSSATPQGRTMKMPSTSTSMNAITTPAFSDLRAGCLRRLLWI
jgi:hypothetical protein